MVSQRVDIPLARISVEVLRGELGKILYPAADGSVHTALEIYGRGLDQIDEVLNLHEQTLVYILGDEEAPDGP